MTAHRTHALWSVSSTLLMVCLTSCAHQERVTIADVRVEAALCSVESEASFRGAAFDGRAVWLSGSGGTVLRSDDFGVTFADVSPPMATELDLRDIEALGEGVALALSAGSPGVILRTDDNGTSWREVYRDDRPEVFLDAMEFSHRSRDGDSHGVVLGDPIDGRFELLESSDGGLTWGRSDARPEAGAGEAGFAASGSCLLVEERSVTIGTGGAPEGVTESSSRVLSRDGVLGVWRSSRVPISRSASAGIFSLCALDGGRLLAVGGDYLMPESRERSAAYSDDGGRTWRAPRGMPFGYRSVVVPVHMGIAELAACAGINGLDLSDDGGETWTNVLQEEVNVLVPFGRSGVVMAAGRGGQIWRVTLSPTAE